MKEKCDRCGKPRVPGGGDKDHCPACYAHLRRVRLGKKVKPPDPERGQRTENFQIAMTPALYAALYETFPDPNARAEWARTTLKQALEVVGIRRKLGLLATPGAQ